MYSTEIKIKEKIVPVKFGAYVLKLLADDGIKLKDLPEQLQDNPADVIPKIIYFGAVNASERRKGEGIDLFDIYDWIDETGGLFCDEVSKVLELFTNQMTDGVPKNSQAETKTPQKPKTK